MTKDGPDVAAARRCANSLDIYAQVPMLIRIESLLGWRHLGVLLGVVYVLVQLLDVRTYPLFVYDEALLSDAGWQLITNGQFRADVLRQVKGFEHHYLWQPPGLALSAAVSYFLFGLGIIQTRIASILFGGLGIWAVHRLIRLTYPPAVGAAVSALILFVWPEWVLTSKMSRMDTAAISALLISTGLVVGALQERESIRRPLLAGLCASLGCAFHSASLPWAAGLGLVLLVFSSRRISAAISFGAGLILIFGSWLLYCAQYPDEFRLQYLSLLTDRLGGGFDLIPIRFFHEFSKVPAIYLVLVLAAIGLFFQLGNRNVRIFLALLAITWVLYAGVIGDSNSGFYSLYPMALVFSAIGIGLDGFFIRRPRPKGSHWARVCASTACALLVLNLALVSLGPRIMAGWFQSKQRDYAKAMAPLVARLKPGDQIWGNAVVWISVVQAHARLDASNWIPGANAPRPDPHVHKYVVVDRGSPFEGIDGYRKLTTFGSDLPLVFGRTLANKPYTFDLWQSRDLGD